ncbi:MAG: YdbL family protein [Desulfobacterales bacterium]|jgi:uncharacterized protein YdbL (DUF1318 family)|nr:YdbL family protein [Desulfobacterales bacterium]
MRRVARILSALAVISIISCVTINIYFPAEEVRNAADKIVNEVWGEQNSAPDAPQTAPPAQGGKTSGLIRSLFEVRSACAAQDIDVSTPAIRAIKNTMKQRSQELFVYLDSGHVGIGSDGLLKVRSTDNLDLKSRGTITRLVAAENADRLQLYKEIATANGFADKAGEVQAIFADSWRDQARPGWHLENPDGGWQQK